MSQLVMNSYCHEKTLNIQCQHHFNLAQGKLSKYMAQKPWKVVGKSLVMNMKMYLMCVHYFFVVTTEVMPVLLNN